MFILPSRKAIKFFGAILFTGTIACTSIFLYDRLFDSEKILVTTIVEEFPKATISLEDIVYEQAKQTGKIFGYENQFSYHYSLDNSPEFVKEDKSDNWFIKHSKNVGSAFVGKKYDVDLSSYFMLGYDFAAISKEDILYDEKTKTLHLKINEIQLAFIPKFEESKFDSLFGFFRMDFTESERKTIYEDAIKQGTLQISENENEIQKGFEMTNQAFENILNSNPSYKNEDITLKFELTSNRVIVINQNQTTEEN